MVMGQASLKARGMPKRSHEEMLQAQCLDSNMMNFGIAVADHFRPDKQKFESFMQRWKALGVLLSSGELQRRYPDVSFDRLHSCAAQIVASSKLTSKGAIEHESFFAALADKLSNS
jgi:hypothetical protein